MKLYNKNDTGYLPRQAAEYCIILIFLKFSFRRNCIFFAFRI